MAGAGQALCHWEPCSWPSGVARVAPAWAEQRAGHLTICRPGHQEPKEASSDALTSRRERSALMEKGRAKVKGPRVQAASLRQDDPAPGLAAASRLALGWVRYIPVIAGGGLILLIGLYFSSDQRPIGELCGLTARPPPSSSGFETLGKSQPFSGPLLPRLSSEGLDRVTPSNSDMLSL